MDMKANKKKLGLKEKYAHMTRGLDWETTYQPKEKVFPQATFEGIKVHDWDKWEDPFRLTMDAYWKYQAEKERKLYAVLSGQAHLQRWHLRAMYLGSAVPRRADLRHGAWGLHRATGSAVCRRLQRGQSRLDGQSLRGAAPRALGPRALAAFFCPPSGAARRRAR